MKNKLAMCGLVGAVLLSGCAQMMTPKTPDLFPNDAYRQGGAAKAEREVKYCMDLADEYVQEPDKFCQMAANVAKGAVVGAGAGTLGGVIMKSPVGRGLAAGAAVGAIVSLASELYDMNEKSPSYQRFVEYCLQKKGYEVTGWSGKE